MIRPLTRMRMRRATARTGRNGLVICIVVTCHK